MRLIINYPTEPNQSAQSAQAEVPCLLAGTFGRIRRYSDTDKGVVIHINECQTFPYVQKLPQSLTPSYVLLGPVAFLSEQDCCCNALSSHT